MLKKAGAVLLCLAAALSLTACGGSKNKTAQADGKIAVSVSFNAMKEFTEAVGKDKVAVSTIVPDGTEPHDFEPTARDLAALSGAKVFVYNGLGMEAWAEKAAETAGGEGLVAVDASKGAEAIAGGGSKTAQSDPHLWLSLRGAELETENIRDALVKADPKDRAFFDKNCAAFVAQLESLYKEYAAKFAAVKNKSIVTGHAAFAYLCRDFSLRENSVEDVFAEGEPSAQKLSSLVSYCRQNHVKTVFVESMVSPDVSRTLADEAGAKVTAIYTVESSEDGESYLSRMSKNLAEIYASLS